jgi:hypothetical protein
MLDQPLLHLFLAFAGILARWMQAVTPEEEEEKGTGLAELCACRRVGEL